MSYEVLRFVCACMLANVAGGEVICLSVPALAQADPMTVVRTNLNIPTVKEATYNVEQGVSDELFYNERDDTAGCRINAVPEDTTNIARMSDNQRSIYIAGAMDALKMYATNVDGPKLTAHFYNCLTKASLNNLQLANNVGAYMKQHPELQAGTVQIPFEHYLRALCGPAPQ
jgi:hypothetical protein